MVIAAGSAANDGSLTFQNNFIETYENTGVAWGDACGGYKMGTGAAETPQFGASENMRLVLCAMAVKKANDTAVSTNPATGYVVYGGKSSTSLSKLGEVTGTSYSHTGLTPGTTYYYAISAKNANGESEQSTIVSNVTK